MDDIIENIILKYSNHPSIKLINEMSKGCFSFNILNVSVIEKEVNALDGKAASMSDGIPPKILKENSCFWCDCILNSVFDSKLKKADLTAVHKVDDTTDKKTTVTLAYLILSKDF